MLHAFLFSGISIFRNLCIYIGIYVCIYVRIYVVSQASRIFPRTHAQGEKYGWLARLIRTYVCHAPRNCIVLCTLHILCACITYAMRHGRSIVGHGFFDLEFVPHGFVSHRCRCCCTFRSMYARTLQRSA